MVGWTSSSLSRKQWYSFLGFFASNLSWKPADVIRWKRLELSDLTQKKKYRSTLKCITKNLIWERRNIKSLKQKTKDRLMVIGILALETVFIYGSISNFYRYIFLKITIDLFLAIFSTIGTAILFVFIIMILMSYLDKRKFLKRFQKWARKEIIVFIMETTACKCLLSRWVLGLIFKPHIQRPIPKV